MSLGGKENDLTQMMKCRGVAARRPFFPWTLLLTLLAWAAVSTSAMAHTDPSKTKIAILIFNDVQVIDYSGPLEVFADAGFDVYTVAASRTPVTTSAGDAVKLTPRYTFADAPQPDVIVIPGGGFEAPANSPTTAWISSESAHAAYIMSVCNGAFTLANTRLLDGLKATTTAGNINRLRQSYPMIHVSPEERVVDNGKIITTAGLSAGIDGALHVVDRLKGEGAGRSVATAMEYDWRPSEPYVRGMMADRLIPSVYRTLNAQNVSDPMDTLNTGSADQWDRQVWYATPKTPSELFSILTAAFAAAYATDGGPWRPGSFRLRSTGASAGTVTFTDQEGHMWNGELAVTPEHEPGQISWRLTIQREN